MRKTKIVCTIGPASMDEKVFTEMCRAGLNVARLNFSHGTHEEQQKKVDMIKKVREELQLPIGIMLDTKGPEYRIKTFKNGKIFLKENDKFAFSVEDIEGDETKVAVTYKGLVNDLDVGDRILLCNGLLVLEVEELTQTEARCRVIVGGEVSDRKSMSFPNKVLRQKYLSEQDKKDLLFGIRNGVDFIAASFVSTKQDILDLKEFLAENGGENIDIIAKIENRVGVNNLKEICDVCEGVLIGRGDLGVEVPFVELPAIQKQIIQTCRVLGKRCITATEMLESMIHNARPTRAEISDVANAVYDGTSAVMLSGETAMGKYPVLTIKTMSEIVEETENRINYSSVFRSNDIKLKNRLDAISHATCGMAIDIDAKAIIVSSRSGMTIRMISRHRVPMDILGLAINKSVYYNLSLNWGVLPVLSELLTTTDEIFDHALTAAKDVLHLKEGDNVVITGGDPSGEVGNTNLIHVETL